ncbi:MAG: hypothetical protein IJ113_01670 [Eggerthellaceae bacterium]|nr:hypothetical protein [Eggerthellaceae bacterium]
MTTSNNIPSYNDGDCILYIRDGEVCKGYVCGIHPASLDIEVVEEVTEERTYVRDGEIVGKIDHVGGERYEYVSVPDPSAPDGVRFERKPASPSATS